MWHHIMIWWHACVKLFWGKYVFSLYKILAVILDLYNIVVCNNNPYFENFLQKMDTCGPPKLSL
jgi:hypothetical protein